MDGVSPPKVMVNQFMRGLTVTGEVRATRIMVGVDKFTDPSIIVADRAATTDIYLPRTT